MSKWWADTLFKRLFLLMWVGLVASHLVALYVVRQVHTPPGAADLVGARLPVLPSLPPMGASPEGTGRPGPPPGMNGDGPPGPPPDGPSRAPPPRDGGNEPESPAGAAGLTASALWLDYGVRFLAIGVVAWFGARWLSEPMRRLATASERLGQALGDGRRGPVLDAQRGTMEVRQTAQVFNTMAERLQSQFEAQGLLMAAISHDLRTPLARLRLRLETMDAQPQTERSIADVREMDALIGSVLGMMRDQHSAAERQRVDIASLAQSLVDDLAEQGEPASVAHAEPAIVSAQPAALSRVLGNLIGNALRHGGVARVSVSVRDCDVHVTVDDDGPGIPPLQLAAVFEPFHRLDSARNRSVEAAAGSGLGLYIARDLAQRNGARLALVNRTEGGLRAELVLPAA
jgi:signal transduction histidine kinase